jgi:hypothetical protein
MSTAVSGDNSVQESDDHGHVNCRQLLRGYFLTPKTLHAMKSGHAVRNIDN